MNTEKNPMEQKNQDDKGARSLFSFLPSSTIFLVFGFLAIACGLMFCGCGYTTMSAIYEEKKIYIPTIENKMTITTDDKTISDLRTYPILLENQLTTAVVNKFNIDGHLRVSNDKDNALRLSCSITNYTKDSLRYTGSDDVEEQRLWLTVHVKLMDSSEKIIFEQDITGKAEYYITGAQAKTEAAARITLVDDTSRRILESVTENW